MSATARKRKEEVAQALKKLIQAKGKTPAMKYQQLLDDLRGQSETVSAFIAVLKQLIHKPVMQLKWLNSLVQNLLCLENENGGSKFGKCRIH